MAERYTSRTLREILRIIASRFLGMVIIIALFVGGVVLVNYVSPREYRAEAQLLANAPETSGTLEADSPSLRENLSNFIQQQRQIITSDSSLAVALYFLQNPAELPENKPGFDPATVAKEDMGNIYNVAPKLVVDEDKIRVFSKANADQVSKLKKRVSIITPGGPDATFTPTFQIRLDWAESRKGFDPSTDETRKKASEDCSKLVALLIRAYEYRYQKIKELRADAAASLVQNAELSAALKARNESEAKLKAKASAIGDDLLTVVGIIGAQGVDSGKSVSIVSLDDRISKINVEIAQLNALNNQLQIQLDKEPQIVAAIRAGEPIKLSENPKGEAILKISVLDEVILKSLKINSIQQEITKIQTQLNTYESEYTDSFKKVKLLRLQLQNNYRSLIRELVAQQDKLKASLAIETQKRDSMQADLDKKRAELNKLGAIAVEYETLQKDFERDSKTYDKAKDKYFKSLADKKHAETPVTVSIIDYETVPSAKDPRRPITWLNMIIGVFAGLIFALAYAFLADYFDHTIKSVDDAERYLGTPVLASIPKLGRNIVKK